MPSIKPSFTAFKGKLTDDAPAGIVTDAGTVTFRTLLVRSVTTSGALVDVFLNSVALAAASPSASLKVVWSIASDSVGESVSTTLRAALPVTNPPADAVNMTDWLPSTRPSSMVPTLKVAEAWLAAIVIAGGVVVAEGWSLAMVTTSGWLKSPLRVTVAAVASAPAFFSTVALATDKSSVDATVVACCATAVPPLRSNWSKF